MHSLFRAAKRVLTVYDALLAIFYRGFEDGKQAAKKCIVDLDAVKFDQR